MKHDQTETIIVLDFGSQYSQLIARRIRECSVYSKILPFNTPAAVLKAEHPRGIILSGGPSSVYQAGAPKCDPEIFSAGIPILGICYGLQLLTHTLGGEVSPGKAREYGKVLLKIAGPSALFAGLEGEIQVWMSHGDKVSKAPAGGFKVLATTANTEYGAVQIDNRDIYGIQFHPEVVHTPQGHRIIKNFCHRICGCFGNWTIASFIERSVREIRENVGGRRVILGLSGGVDSSVAAALIHKAIGRQLTCIFVNNGLLRKNEADRVRKLFGDNFRMDLVYVDATVQFMTALAGVDDPETKRKIIGREFVAVFDRAAAGIEGAEFLAQGTTYPDVIESVPIDGNPAAMIKSHHNVGGLPQDLKFKLLEPLSRLFKDEVREVGRQLGLPKDVVMRQPFPGPGLAVRHLGAVTTATLDILRDADEIIVDEIKKAGLYYETWQTFGVFLPVRTVGVMGDERTYDYVIALRAVESSDGMTADWVKLPYEVLENISNRIINEVRGVNRVVYDITSKPPGTIEWE
ncbi:MAG: glutamine-hydrolyzing GMP synthase [Victivallaceae bacterium]|nr:glutamine-hydrolyzing GMP synthase [Victivallaceae bacterium]